MHGILLSFRSFFGQLVTLYIAKLKRSPRTSKGMMSLHKANTLLGMVVIPVILAYRRLRQEDHEFPDNLSYIARLCLKNKNKTTHTKKGFG